MLIDCICFASLKRLFFKFIIVWYIISHFSFGQSFVIVKGVDERLVVSCSGWMVAIYLLL